MSERYGFTVPFDQFLPEVLPYVPDVPEFVAINAIRNAAIEFCEKTYYLQVDADPITAVANVGNYEIDTPPDTAFIDVVQGWYNNVLLIPKGIDELSRIYRSLDWRQLYGNPAYITRVIQPEIMLVPIPVTTIMNSLTLRIAIAPTRAATTVPSRLYEHYTEVIGIGARARLYGTPGQPYYNAGAAEVSRKRFYYEIANARRKVQNGLGRATNRIEFVGFV